MSIFKRAEVLILLVLVVAGVVFVILSDQENGGDDPDSKSNNARTSGTRVETGAEPHSPAFATGGALQIKGVNVRREKQAYLTEVRFSFDNQTDETVNTLDEAKLITGTGKSAPVFFLAFTGAPPALRPKMKSEASLQFSLLAEDVVGELDLVVGAQRAQVKSAHSFDPESIANSQAKTFSDRDW